MREAFPTIVEYTGLVLMVVLIGVLVTGFAAIATVAPAFIPVTGMIMYRRARRAVSGDDG